MKKLLIATPICIALSIFLVLLGRIEFIKVHLVDGLSNNDIIMFIVESIVLFFVAIIVSVMIGRKYSVKETSTSKKVLLLVFNIIVIILGISGFVYYFNC